jgi:hypothetical protein
MFIQNRNMKKVIYIVFLIVFGLIKSSDVSGQQVLWTTMDGIPNEKYIPVENVKGKVLEYYGTYQYYIDGSGYDIDSFLKTFKLGSQIGEFKKIMKETCSLFKNQLWSRFYYICFNFGTEEF